MLYYQCHEIDIGSNIIYYKREGPTPLFFCTITKVVKLLLYLLNYHIKHYHSNNNVDIDSHEKSIGSDTSG